MIRTLKGWEEELSTNSRINGARMITQDWRENNESIINTLISIFSTSTNYIRQTELEAFIKKLQKEIQ